MKSLLSKEGETLSNGEEMLSFFFFLEALLQTSRDLLKN